MPIIHFINNKTQTAGGMKNVLNYVGRKEKTVSEDKRFVTGINCSPETALDEMTATKNLFHKNDGRLYYHLVQSFPSGYEIEPELAHKIAVELAEKAFGKYEVVVATHIDREHIHSHLVLNSVSFEDGKKYHSNKESVEQLMKLSDEICQKYGVHVLDTPKKKMNRDYLSDSEYRSAKRGESFKWELMNVINQVMKQAKTKKQFCYLMKQQGYDVRWEDNRKYITYTCPNGRRCRDNKLHEAKYRKENMEYEFEIRRSESSLQAEYAGCTGHTDHGLRPGQQLAGADLAAETSDRYAIRCQGSDRRDNDIRTDGTVHTKSADNLRSAAGTGEGDTGADVTERDGRGIEAGSGGGVPRLTGWEAERADLIAAEMLRRAEQKSRLQTAPTGGADRSAAPDIVGGIAALASIIEDKPADDTEYAREHVDRKALAEERERKEAHGIHMR